MDQSVVRTFYEEGSTEPSILQVSKSNNTYVQRTLLHAKLFKQMIQGVELTDLSMVMGESGAVHHFMRTSDPLFVGLVKFIFQRLIRRPFELGKCTEG